MQKISMRAAVAMLLGWPGLMLAQQPVERVGSWEFTVSGGVTLLGSELRDSLSAGPAAVRYTTSDDPGKVLPTIGVRLGYNFDNHWGASIGGSRATGSGARYLTPFGALTYTFDLNARTSPFLTGGLQVTRISGENNNRTHPTWGAHLGLGIRSMLSEHLALRLEGRLGREYYQRPHVKVAYLPVATLGLSYFTPGRRSPPPPHDPKPCDCAVGRIRVDTVRIMVAAPPPPVRFEMRDTLVLEGVNFDFDSADLLPDDKVILDRVALGLMDPKWAPARFEVAGHTSGIGTTEYNLELSRQRAEAVVTYLVSKGVPRNRLIARGYGEANPRYPNDREGRSWQNRRVELRRQ